MGHDILGYNKAQEEVAYLRFTMGDPNATILYSLLDADVYNAGVSGSGGSTALSTKQIEKALNTYKQICGIGERNLSNSDFEIWQQRETLSFLLNCLETAQKEKSVRVFFG